MVGILLVKFSYLMKSHSNYIDAESRLLAVHATVTIQGQNSRESKHLTSTLETRQAIKPNVGETLNEWICTVCESTEIIKQALH